MSQSNGTQESIDTLSGLLEAIKTGNESDFDVASLPNLLAKLDSANNAAEGLEGRLDALLAELDGMRLVLSVVRGLISCRIARRARAESA